MAKSIEKLQSEIFINLGKLGFSVTTQSFTPQELLGEEINTLAEAMGNQGDRSGLEKLSKALQTALNVIQTSSSLETTKTEIKTWLNRDSGVLPKSSNSLRIKADLNMAGNTQYGNPYSKFN